VVVMTMVRDERDMLPRWLDHYAREVGVESLVVLDDGSVDGSTSNLPCTVIRVPTSTSGVPWSRARTRLVNGFATALLAVHDVVVFTDVDEFLVADPAKYDGLVDYLARNRDKDVVAPLGVNVLHAAGLEPALDPTRPVLEQRQFVKVAPVMCKPLLKRVAAPWSEGFHGIRARFAVDPDLLLVHLKYYDVDALRTVAAQRQRVNTTEGRGSPLSAWNVPAEELVERLDTWVAAAAGDVAVLEPSRVPVSEFVTEGPNGFRARGRQLAAMDRRPLRRLPERYRRML